MIQAAAYLKYLAVNEKAYADTTELLMPLRISRDDPVLVKVAHINRIIGRRASSFSYIALQRLCAVHRPQIRTKSTTTMSTAAQVHGEPWLKPGVNYSDSQLAPTYCQDDGGVWNVSGKWCTPIPGSNYTLLWGNVTEHQHDAIGYYGDAPRSFSNPSIKLLALLVCITVVLTSALSGNFSF